VPNDPPTVQINSPPEGEVIGLSTSISLVASAYDAEDLWACCSFSWSSDVDGSLGSGATVAASFASEGPRTITVTAVDAAGASASASVHVTVSNGPPIATIYEPAADATVLQGVPVRVLGSGIDPNDGTLACALLSWDDPGGGEPIFPVTGCEADLTFANLGPHTLRLTATDSGGLTGTAEIGLTVEAPPVNRPPEVVITSPRGSVEGRPPEFLDHRTPIPVAATASDAEGDAVTLHWFASWTDAAGLFHGEEIGAGATSFEWIPATSGFDCIRINVPVTLSVYATDASNPTCGYPSCYPSVVVIIQCPPG